MKCVAEAVAAEVEEAVRTAVEGLDVAVAFSGGVDSSLIALLSARHAGSVRLYVAGTYGSHDVAAAEKTAEGLGMDLTVIPMDEASVMGSLRSQIEVVGPSSPLTLSFEIPLWHVLDGCAEKHVLTGQGADELFVGYRKYAGASRAELADRRIADLTRLREETIPHEDSLASYFDKDAVRPYLSDGVSGILESLPLEEIDPFSDASKPLMREVARILGLGDAAGRPKKAAQYGSGAMDIIRSICRRRGIAYNRLVGEMVSESCFPPTD